MPRPPRFKTACILAGALLMAWLLTACERRGEDCLVVTDWAGRERMFSVCVAGGAFGDTAADVKACENAARRLSERKICAVPRALPELLAPKQLTAAPPLRRAR